MKKLVRKQSSLTINSILFPAAFFPKLHTYSCIIDNVTIYTFPCFSIFKGELWSQFAEGVKSIRLPAGTGLVGYVAKTGETLNIDDVLSDDRFNQELDLRTGYRTRNVLCMPIRHHDEPQQIMGVVQIINKSDGSFTKADEELLDQTISRISHAVQNCRSFSRIEAEQKRALDQVTQLEERLKSRLAEEAAKQRHVEMMDRIVTEAPLVASKVATATEVHEMFNQVVQYARTWLEADRGTLYLVDRTKQELWSEIAEGAEPIRIPLTSGIVGSVVQTAQIVNIDDAYEDKRFNQAIDRQSG